MRLRGLLTLTVTLTVAMALTLTACAKSTAGLEGWPALPEPVAWTPPSGVCHAAFTSLLRRDGFGEIECTKTHQAELIHLGQFTGDAVSAEKVPEPGSPAFQAAWSDCDAKTTAYLGGPWKERKLRLGIAVPTAYGWDSGARWYACEVTTVKQLNGFPQHAAFSLKGAFGTQPSLLFGCMQVAEEGAWEQKNCDQPHNAEFAGLVPWDTSYEELNKEIERENDSVHRRCVEVVGGFVGASVPTGTYVWVPDKTAWNAGDKTLRCFLWLGDGKSVSRSMRGVGRAGWPLR